METIILELIKIIPSFLWFLFSLAIVLFFYRPIKENILPRLHSFEAAGIKFSIISESIDAAFKLAEEIGNANNQKANTWNINIDPDSAKIVENRVKANIRILKNIFILWIDDHPEFNINERKMFKHLGVEIDTALSSEQAKHMLNTANYDLIFSDIARGNDQKAGLKFLDDLMSKNKFIDILFYVGHLDSPDVPRGSFGITNKPNELVHLTLDVLERTKY